MFDQSQRASQVAPGFLTAGQLPGPVVATDREQISDRGLVRLERQRGLQVGDRRLKLSQDRVHVAPRRPQVRILGPQVDGLSEVVDPLAGALEFDQGMTAMVIGIGVGGIVLELRGVPSRSAPQAIPCSARCVRPAVHNRPGAGAAAGPKGWPGRRRNRQAQSQSRPIAARCVRMARRSHMCTAGPSRVLTTSRDPSGLKAAAHTPHPSGLSSRATVRPRLVLHQADHPVRILDRQQAAIGRKAETTAADLPHFAPGAGLPEPARRIPRHQPFPVGAELNANKPLDLQMRFTPARRVFARPGRRSCHGCRLPSIPRPG